MAENFGYERSKFFKVLTLLYFYWLNHGFSFYAYQDSDTIASDARLKRKSILLRFQLVLCHTAL